MAPIRDQVSSPTPFRSALKTFLFSAAAWNFRIGQIDVSQAFIQADIMSGHDQVLVDAPDCIALPWAQEVKSQITRPVPFSKWVFLAKRPLYGLRESPLRRPTHISSCLRRHGYMKMRGDVCIFTRIGNTVLRAIALLYVDYFLSGFPNSEEMRRFATALGEYRPIDIEFLTMGDTRWCF